MILGSYIVIVNVVNLASSARTLTRAMLTVSQARPSATRLKGKETDEYEAYIGILKEISRQVATANAHDVSKGRHRRPS